MNFKEFKSSFSEYRDSKRDCENHECIAFIRDESQKSPRDGEGDFDKDEIADVISAVLMDVLKSLDD